MPAAGDEELLFQGIPEVEVSNFSNAMQTTRANDVTQNVSQMQLSSPYEKQDQHQVSQNPIQKILSFEESAEHGQPPSFAQSHQIGDAPKSIYDDQFFYDTRDVEAVHQLQMSFKKDLQNEKMLDFYRERYQFHKQETERYRALYMKILESKKEDLDEEPQPIPGGVRQAMKDQLMKKSDQL